MIEIVNNGWLFFGGILVAIFLISKLMRIQPKSDKALEEQYRLVLTSEKYKVK